MTCRFCPAPVERKKHGTCLRCYRRARRNGWIRCASRKAGCDLEGCPRPYHSNGYCYMHFMRWRKDGDPGEVEPRLVRGRVGCEIPWCEKPHYAKGKCKGHYYMARNMAMSECQGSLHLTYLPVEPIARFVEQLRFDYEEEVIAERAGLDPGTLRSIRYRRRPSVRFTTADKLVTAFDGDPRLLEVA